MPEYQWPPDVMALADDHGPDLVENICDRCAKRIRKGGSSCNAQHGAEKRKCSYCAKQHKKCIPVERRFHSRVNWMGQMYKHCNQGAAINFHAEDVQHQRGKTVLKMLKGAEKRFTKDCNARARVVHRNAEGIAPAAQAPRTTEDFLGMILREQRAVVVEQRRSADFLGRVAVAVEGFVAGQLAGPAVPPPAALPVAGPPADGDGGAPGAGPGDPVVNADEVLDDDGGEGPVDDPAAEDGHGAESVVDENMVVEEHEL